MSNFKHGCTDDRKIMVDVEEHKRLQARIKELEAINLGLTKTLLEEESEKAKLVEALENARQWIDDCGAQGGVQCMLDELDAALAAHRKQGGEEMSAIELLERAAGHLKGRAATYDKPEGMQV